MAAADPEKAAQNLYTILGKIETRMKSIASLTAKAAASGTAMGAGMGGGHAGGNGPVFGAAGAGGGSGGGLGLASVPGPAGGSAGGSNVPHASGGGGGQGNIGLGRVAANAAGNAMVASLSRFGTDRLGSATATDILATRFAMQGQDNLTGSQLTAAKNKWTHGLGLAGFNGYSRQDDAQAAGNLGRLYTASTDSNSGFQKTKSMLGAQSLKMPGFSANEQVGFLQQTSTPDTYNRLRQAGVSGTDKYGNGMNPDALAKQFLAKLSPASRTSNNVRRLLAPGGSLDSWLSYSGITGSNRAQFEQRIIADVSGNDSVSGNTVDAATKNVAEAQNKTGLLTDQGVVKGAAAGDAALILKESAKQFTLAVDKFAEAQGFGTGFGQVTGHKGLGVAAGILHWLNTPIFGGGIKDPKKLIADAQAAKAAQTQGSGGAAGITNTGHGGAIGGAATGTGGGSSSSTAASTAGASGASAGSSKTLKHVWPVGNVAISQPFMGGSSHNHPGVDFPAPKGTPIHAAADGVVIWAGPMSGFGSHFVAIYHSGENKVTRYGHCSALYCKVGDNVVAGTVVAAVGSEGISSGDHLHLELANGKAPSGGAAQNLNPIPWLGGAATSTATAGDSSSSSSSPSSSSSGAAAASSGHTGFQTLSSVISQGLTSALLGSSGSAGVRASSGSSSSSGAAGTAGGGGGGMVAGDWAKNLPAAGQQYAPLIQKAAHETGVNPALIAAVMNTESSFYNNPGSGDGLSSGLMQFIKSTGQAYGLMTPADHMNPAKDILAGGRYLKDLLSSHGGDIAGALRSYNGSVGSDSYSGPVMATFKSYGDGGATGSYEKGAWELKRDEVAQVHEGEMIVPKGPASAMRSGAGRAANVRINVTLQNASNTEALRLVAIVKASLQRDDTLSALGGT